MAKGTHMTCHRKTVGTTREVCNQAGSLYRMAQHQPSKREERTEGHRRLSARTEAKTCLRLLQHQSGNLQIHGR